MNTDRKVWVYCLFPAVAMSLGWGLRGFIRGGSFGAMILGALVALALCLLLDREGSRSGLIAAFGAIGVGFGGQETYGQTVGFAIAPETFYWGIAGLALKGAIWGLLGGAVLGLGLTRERTTRAAIGIASVLMIAGTYAGWKLINEPKLIYFSNRFDKPRGEIWAGLLLGALALLGTLALRHGARIPARFAFWGALGGGIGFGGGGTLMAIGMQLPVDHRWYAWWKLMEFIFGFCFGCALGFCAYLHRERLRGGEAGAAPGKPAALPAWLASLLATLAIAAVFVAEWNSLLRLPYTVLGAALITVALYSQVLAWQIAITMTYCATATNLILHLNRIQLGASFWHWVFVAGTTWIVSYLVVSWERRGKPVLPCFLLLMWTTVAMSFVKTPLVDSQILFPSSEALAAAGGRLFHTLQAIGGQWFVQVVFALQAAVLAWMIRRRFHRPGEPLS